MLARKLLGHGIMNKPPEYLKVWIYLLSKASHKDTGSLQRGQGFSSIPEIQDMLSYLIGFRKIRPSKKQVWGILEWLRNPENGKILRDPYEGNDEGNMTVPMIVTTKVTHGFVYTIVKYDLYQRPTSYKGNGEGNDEGTMKELRRERQGNNINKNLKNYNKEEVEEVVIDGDAHSLLKRLIKHYSKNINAVPTPVECELLLSWLDEGVEIDLIEWAITQAALNKGLSAKYVSKIILNKIKEGITTREQAESFEKIREAKKQGKEPFLPAIDTTPVLSAEQITRMEELDRILLEGDDDIRAES